MIDTYTTSPLSDCAMKYFPLQPISDSATSRATRRECHFTPNVSIWTRSGVSPGAGPMSVPIIDVAVGRRLAFLQYGLKLECLSTNEGVDVGDYL